MYKNGERLRKMALEFPYLDWKIETGRWFNSQVIKPSHGYRPTFYEGELKLIERCQVPTS